MDETKKYPVYNYIDSISENCKSLTALVVEHGLSTGQKVTAYVVVYWLMAMKLKNTT